MCDNYQLDRKRERECVCVCERERERVEREREEIFVSSHSFASLPHECILLLFLQVPQKYLSQIVHWDVIQRTLQANLC